MEAQFESFFEDFDPLLEDFDPMMEMDELKDNLEKMDRVVKRHKNLILNKLNNQKSGLLFSEGDEDSLALCLEGLKDDSQREFEYARNLYLTDIKEKLVVDILICFIFGLFVIYLVTLVSSKNRKARKQESGSLSQVMRCCQTAIVFLAGLTTFKYLYIWEDVQMFNFLTCWKHWLVAAAVFTYVSRYKCSDCLDNFVLVIWRGAMECLMIDVVYFILLQFLPTIYLFKFLHHLMSALFTIGTTLKAFSSGIWCEEHFPRTKYNIQNRSALKLDKLPSRRRKTSNNHKSGADNIKKQPAAAAKNRELRRNEEKSARKCKNHHQPPSATSSSKPKPSNKTVFLRTSSCDLTALMAPDDTAAAAQRSKKEAASAANNNNKAVKNAATPKAKNDSKEPKQKIKSKGQPKPTPPPPALQSTPRIPPTTANSAITTDLITANPVPPPVRNNTTATTAENKTPLATFCDKKMVSLLSEQHKQVSGKKKPLAFAELVQPGDTITFTQGPKVHPLLTNTKSKIEKQSGKASKQSKSSSKEAEEAKKPSINVLPDSVDSFPAYNLLEKNSSLNHWINSLNPIGTPTNSKSKFLPFMNSSTNNFQEQPAAQYDEDDVIDFKLDELNESEMISLEDEGGLSEGSSSSSLSPLSVNTSCGSLASTPTSLLTPASSRVSSAPSPTLSLRTLDPPPMTFNNISGPALHRLVRIETSDVAMNKKKEQTYNNKQTVNNNIKSGVSNNSPSPSLHLAQILRKEIPKYSVDKIAAALDKILCARSTSSLTLNQFRELVEKNLSREEGFNTGETNDEDIFISDSEQEDEDDSSLFEDCPICTEPLITQVKSLEVCGHKFHAACVDAWLGKQKSCPTCRSNC